MIEEKDETINTNLHMQYKALGNYKIFLICSYLSHASVGTCSVIARSTGLKKPLVSKYTSRLEDVGLLRREKWFTMQVFLLTDEAKKLMHPQPKDTTTKKNKS